ncbi:unnamed protein product [Lampetra fluviatilis]
MTPRGAFKVGFAGEAGAGGAWIRTRGEFVVRQLGIEPSPPRKTGSYFERNSPLAHAATALTTVSVSER